MADSTIDIEAVSVKPAKSASTAKSSKKAESSSDSDSFDSTLDKLKKGTDNATTGVMAAYCAAAPAAVQNNAAPKGDASVTGSELAAEAVGDALSGGSKGSATNTLAMLAASSKGLVITNPAQPKTDADAITSETAVSAAAELTGQGLEPTGKNTDDSKLLSAAEIAVSSSQYSAKPQAVQTEGISTQPKTFAAEIDAASAAGNSTTAVQAQILTPAAQASNGVDKISAKLSGAAVNGAKTLKTENTPVIRIEQTQTAEKSDATKQSADSNGGDSKGFGGDAKGKGDTASSQAIFTTAQLSSPSTKSTSSVSEAIKTDVANQISNSVKDAVASGKTEVKIHLSPEELGGISLKIVSENGVISLQISADNKTTGQLLASSMQELTHSMQEHGITMNKTEVTYQGTGFDSTTYGQGQQQNGQNGSYTLPKWTPAMDSQKSEDSAESSAVRAVSSAGQTQKTSGMSILA